MVAEGNCRNMGLSSTMDEPELEGLLQPSAQRGPWTRHWGLAALAAALAGAACVAVLSRGGEEDQSVVSGLVQLHFDDGVLQWNGWEEDTKCLDVDGGNNFAGAHVQVWTCDPHNHDQQFIFPRKRGMIRWKHNPQLCVRPENYTFEEQSPIVLWDCNETDELQHWVMPNNDNGTGAIQLKVDPSKCLVEDNINDMKPEHKHNNGHHSKKNATTTTTTPIPTHQNGVDARLGRCPVKSMDANKTWDTSLFWSEGQLQQQTPNGVICLRATKPSLGSTLTAGWCQSKEYSQFIFPGRFGLIRWNAYPDLCVDVAGGNYSEGHHLQLWTCNDTIKSMMWEVPSGPGPVRLRHRPDICIAGPKTGEIAKIYGCGLEEKKTVPWSCHRYEEGQDNAWCTSAGVRGGMEYAFRAHGGMCDTPDGDSCWCCKRPAWGVEQDGEEKNEVVKKDEEHHEEQDWVPWKCHNYGVGQDNDWCQSAGVQDGIEYVFRTGGGMCGKGKGGHLCWCCKRPEAKEERKLLLGSTAHTTTTTTRTTTTASERSHLAKKNGTKMELWLNETWNIVDQPKWSGGFPSLYCVSVIRPWGYERDIMTALLAKAIEQRSDFGIFACDDFDVFSAERVMVGWHHLQGDVYTNVFPQAWVGVSKDGTAGNAELFMHLWDTVKAIGKFQNYDWTLKLDPDAVIIPERVRWRLSAHNQHFPQFVENCNAIPSSPDYPMIYGAAEMFSKEAMQKYYAMEWNCRGMDWHPLGEDVFMRRCMVQLGVSAIVDLSMVGDYLCTYANCGEGWRAVFHPFKSLDSWLGCWYQAHR